MQVRLLIAAFTLLIGAGCSCKSNVAKIPPSLKVSPGSFDFGPVKSDSLRRNSAVTTFTLTAQTSAQVTITAVKLSSGGEPGGAEDFAVGLTPTSIDKLSSKTFDVTFSPVAVQASEAILTIESDDPDRQTTSVLLTGTGKQSVIAVTPQCDLSRKCTGTVTVIPPAIDFGAEPFVRLLPIDVTALPSVAIVNEGLVELKVTRIAVEGADASSFTIPGNSTVPAQGLLLAPAEGRNLSIRFKPASEAQPSYTAEVVIDSDDPLRPSVHVLLTGTLRPNLPPSVCANLIKVQPIDDAERDYSSKAEWARWLVPPAAGYDFTRNRDVEPRSVAIFSAFSDPVDQTQCTTDPEDGRLGLTYEWKLLSAPAGAMGLGISNATAPQATLRPIVTGEYTLQLTVMDTQLHATVVRLKFAVALKQDLVAQLQWTGFADVDLDVHLVRPSAATQPGDPFSGVFDFFENGPANTTAGDINGYALTKQRPVGSGFDFDWGSAGTSDDPKLNIDDIGSGSLLENVSLNYPEHDPKCATTSCRYKVLVHYFKDGRTAVAPAACVIDGGVDCLDGQACGCAAPGQCVADSAPRADAGAGVGKCYAPPRPVVRIFLKGSATPALTVPVDLLVPPDELSIGAPCQMLYVADIDWPSKTLIGSLADGGTPLATVSAHGGDDAGRVVTPTLARFGWRQAGGSLQCSPDTTKGAAVDWYTQQP